MPIASAVFTFGLVALLASVLVVRPAARSDNADSADSPSATATPTASPAPDRPEPTPEVLGRQQTSNRVAITAALVVDATAVPLPGNGEATIVDGAIRADWRLSEIPDALGTDRGFVSITVEVTAGAIAFDPDADAVIEIRCVRGACADWRQWTPLPAGVVTEGSAITLVARADFVGVDAFAVRTVRDPGSYTTP